MRALLDYMIIGFRLGTIVAATCRAGEQYLSDGVRVRFLILAASNRQVPSKTISYSNCGWLVGELGDSELLSPNRWYSPPSSENLNEGLDSNFGASEPGEDGAIVSVPPERREWKFNW